MKKTLTLIYVLLLINCSNNSSSTDPTNPPEIKYALPRMYIFTYLESGTTTQVTETFNYNGNKLLWTEGIYNYKTVYTYTGDNINKIEELNKGVLESTTNYFYVNGKLNYRTKVYSYGTAKTIYIYNTDGTITTTDYFIVNGVERKEAVTVSTFTNGNLTKEVIDGTLVRTYEYDNKISPYSGILGIKVLWDLDYERKGDSYVMTNNLLKVSGVSYPASGEEIHTNKYNTNNYLTETKYGTTDEWYKTEFVY